MLSLIHKRLEEVKGYNRIPVEEKLARYHHTKEQTILMEIICVILIIIAAVLLL